MSARTFQPWRTFLGTLLALAVTVASAMALPPTEAPTLFNPTPGASLPFAALAVGLGAEPATAPLSAASLQTANNILPSNNARTQTVLGSATLVLMGNGSAGAVTELALLQGSDRLGCWTLVNTDLARPLPPLILMRFPRNRETPLPTLTSNVLEYDALSYALILAAQNSPAAFRTSAAANRGLSYAMMFQQPGAYIGKVVHIEGDALWVNQLETPPQFETQGLKHLYEVWILDKPYSATPYSVLLTELPADLPIGKRINVPVSLDGYFLKRRLEPENAVRQKAWQHSLLIAAHSLTVRKRTELMITQTDRSTVGAATLVLSGTLSPVAPLGELALLRNGERAGCWTLVNSDVVRPLAQKTLDHIKDGATMPADASGGMEFDALSEVLVQTWYTSPAAFAKAAKKDLSFVQLFEYPKNYRGTVVHIEGRLRLVQRWEPPPAVRDAGVPIMYEATIFDDASGGNPYIVLFTDAPEGIPLNKKVNEPVAFDGYFYKKWHYKALDTAETGKPRAAPLLIGRSVKVLKPATKAPAAADSDNWIIPAIAIGLGLLTVGVVVMFFMAWWLRRHDARVHAKLHAVRTKTFVLPGVDEPIRRDKG